MKTKIKEMKNEFQIDESVLLDFFNGNLSEEERRKVLVWRDACEANRELFRAVHEGAFVMKTAVRARLIEGDYSSLQKRMAWKRSHKLLWIWNVAVAAVVVVVVTIPLLWQQKPVETKGMILPAVASESGILLEMSDGERYSLSGNAVELKEKDGSQLAINEGQLVYDRKSGEYVRNVDNALKYNKITVPRGAGVYQVALSDGSLIWLNSDSRLEYPEYFAKGERRVRICGEAFLKVKRDTSRPFVVETDRQHIKVLGTEFNVFAYPAEPEATTLVSGKVNVASKEVSESVVLEPGEQAVWDEETDSLSVCHVNVDDIVAWKDGIISIENMPLSRILKVVARAYDVDFDTSGLETEDVVLKGSISSDEALEVFLAVLSKAAEVKFKVRADGKIEVQYVK